jgi:hypothetical protein
MVVLLARCFGGLAGALDDGFLQLDQLSDGLAK